MSDHVDGPRSVGEPAADVTDLFAFTSPENPGRIVLAMCVFPYAGENAIFSNVIDYSIAVRRVSVAGIGNAARFQPADDEIRFSFRFETLKRDAPGNAIQRGVCKLPDGRDLQLTVNEETGTSTPEGDIRAFAGLRSDPFYIGLDVATLQPVPNQLQHNNVLCMVVEFDTRSVLDPTKGSLFGAVAETIPPQQATRLAPAIPRIDWVGRPEQTNVRLNNPALSGIDIRDLWNQQTPFAISKELQPMFLKRLKDSFANWDMKDGKADWSPDALATNANVFLDDFLLFDLEKPITDQSHLEIEKSTINGRPYQTGGGRTVDANVFDILLTWLANRDRKFIPGGATGATKPGMKVFPFFATPNTELQTVSESVELAAAPDAVWSHSSYNDVSPFPLAWVCFQLGMLWGELVSVPDHGLAAHWYRRAIAYLPGYVKARVHLAEICASQGRTGDAEALLLPALSSSDPEVNWRLADVLIAQGKFEEAERQLNVARFGFDQLLERYLLAFADHAAEFYAGSGNDCRRALKLARTNVANRPTRRAVKQVCAIAVIADDASAVGDPREPRAVQAAV